MVGMDIGEKRNRSVLEPQDAAIMHVEWELKASKRSFHEGGGKTRGLRRRTSSSRPDWQPRGVCVKARREGELS